MIREYFRRTRRKNGPIGYRLGKGRKEMNERGGERGEIRGLEQFHTARELCHQRTLGNGNTAYSRLMIGGAWQRWWRCIMVHQSSGENMQCYQVHAFSFGTSLCVGL